MSLSAGARLGPYEIVAPLGAGGMGEVYRARDTKLNRSVAIKVLPESFVHDPDRLARFEREARVLASLNHPNIAHIHGLEESCGISALVMELVDGEDLSETLEGLRAKGSGLPLDEALPIAKQIADALEAAHEQGIVHRDLKPANIKVRPDGTVKVLDFGLAKAMETVDAASANGSQSAAITTPAMTQAGMILGTAAYMSPEQARGKPVDRRTDIWAFGCVLFELLTGRTAFGGKTATDTLAAIIEREPPWTALAPGTPAGIRRLLQRCMEKDPRRRLHDIADARIEIEDALSGSGASPRVGKIRGFPIAWSLGGAIAMLIVGAVITGSIVWRLRPAAAAAPPVRFTADVVAGSALGPAPSLAISPDGRRVAYVAAHEVNRQLYLREVDRFDARPLPGTDGAAQPFFSPDGEWLGFFAGAKLKKVRLTGGPAMTVCDAINARGGAWTPDGRIIFAPTSNGPLVVVSAEGGAPRALTTLDRPSESSHRWPHVSPNGEVLLFGAGPPVTGANWNEAHVVAQSLRTGERRVVAMRGTYPRFAPDGQLLYVQDGTLYAQAIAGLAVIGKPRPVIDMLEDGCCGGFQFDISRMGSIVYATAPSEPAQPMVWVDRHGHSEPVPMPAARYGENGPRLSPDGTRIALTITTSDSDSDVWVYDIARNTSLRLTFGGINLWPVWTPDGARITYANPRSSWVAMYSKSADGAGAEQQLTAPSAGLTAPPLQGVPGSWSPDSSVLAFFATDDVTGSDIWMWSAEGSGRATPFVRTSAAEQKPVFSPGGHAVAYVTNESGRREVVVRPYPGPSVAVQVSTSGGDEPVWARNGRELFFRRGDAMLAVEMTADGASAVGLPRPLFSGKYAHSNVAASYDVTADGQRFLMMPAAADHHSVHFSVVLDWAAELNRSTSVK